MTFSRRGPRTDRAMARGGSPRPASRILSLAVVALVASAAAAIAPRAHAQNVDGLQRQLVDIEGDLAALTRDQLSHTAVRSPTYVEERLTDGELFYRLQDYLRASIIFTDIVDNHQNHTAYSDALFLLGDSLFRAGDYLGARSRFRQVLDHANEPQFRPYVQRALGRLIEIAIHIRDFDGVDRYFQTLSRLPPTEVEATTAYFRAKYLYSRAVPLEEQLAEAEAGTSQIDLNMLEESRVAFEAVPQGSPYYPQARYFIGVVHTLRAEFPQAIEAFRRVLRSEATTPEAQKVIDLTHLALGRLYYETDQLDQASEAYQAVPRTSPHFDDALYEIAWVYIRLGDATRAERALEVLSVAVPDSPHIPDGKILRGNLLLRNGRFEDATQVFREVRNEFGPVFRDLEEVRESHADLHAHFRTLVRTNLESFDVNTFLPETARRWVDLEGDFERAVGALSDLSQARQLVGETSDLITRLNAAISAPNRVSIFADLRRHRETTTALRNRLTQVRRRALQIEGDSGGGSGELAEVRAQRRRIERTLGGMPTNEDDFIVRDDQLLNRYRQLERELSNLQVELLGLDARIVATRRFLDDTQDDQTSDTTAVLAELEQQERAVANYRAQIDEIERLIEIARIQVGVGDARYERDNRLRDEYNRLVARERELGGGNSRTNALFSRIARIESDLDTHDRLIESRVEERISDMRRVIAEESEKLVGYREALTTLEDETEDVVGAITYTSFSQVRDRFYDLVLRADVGRIDVTWAQREEHRMRVDMLTRERSREIQALDDEFRDIMDDGQGSGDEQ